MLVMLLVLLPVLSPAAPPAPLQRTGQTSCFDATGAQVPCAGTGQDGETLAGVAWTEPRILDNGDMTATDQLTGLVWSVDADSAGLKSWQQALDYINQLNLNTHLGYSDWRLPNLLELKSLLTYQDAPTTWLASQATFSKVQAGYYWTSTTSPGNTAAAWLVNLGTGVIDDLANKYLEAHVWPVRGDGSGGLLKLPRTGQAGCWNNIGASIPCTGTGQDGELQTGVPWPEPRFFDLADGTVKDALTGLIWSKDAGPAGGTKDWQGALTAVKNLNSNSSLYKDWRLPNALEMASLVSQQEENLPNWLLSKGFYSVQADYWTATTDATTPANGWQVRFPKVTPAAVSLTGDGAQAENDLTAQLAVGYGNSKAKTQLSNVWPVRTDLEPPVVTANPPGGKRQKPLTITLSANEPATIYYTTSGVDPTTQSTVYSAPLSVSLDTVLKFLAIDPLGNQSAVSTESYTIVPLTTATPPGGTYNTPQTVTLTTNEPATIYYTTSGADPTTQSTVYSNPLSVSLDTVLKFFAVNALGNAEDIRTETYLIIIAPPVNGACGSAGGGVFTAAPTTNLCAAGTPSAVSGSGPWSWSCAGANGGTTASCTANIASYLVSFSAAAGGSVSGNLSQTVTHGTSTTAVTAVADSGYQFVNWTGSGGFVTTTANPLTVTSVTAALNITANFTPVVTITSKPLTKPLGYKGGKKKLSFTAAASLTPTQIVQSISKPDWITIPVDTVKFAKGKGSLSYSVAANPSIETLQGDIWIGSASYQVSQAPTPCKIMSVTVGTLPVPKVGGLATVSVDVFPEACTWRLSSAAVTPCAKGSEQLCLDDWFSDPGTFPAIGDLVVGNKTFSGTVSPLPGTKARTYKGVAEIFAGGKSVKKFSIKQLAK
jgi:uncharacterized repeat protein (TIGR02543 family)